MIAEIASPTVSIERTEDAEWALSMFLNRDIYEAMRDDACPDDPAKLMGTKIDLPGGIFLKANLEDGAPCGVFWLLPREGGYEAHTALLPTCRGAMAVCAAKEAIRWVFDNTDAREITSYAWSDTPQVKWFCRSVGMTARNTTDWPNTRSGRPVKITYYGIRREEVK